MWAGQPQTESTAAAARHPVSHLGWKRLIPCRCLALSHGAQAAGQDTRPDLSFSRPQRLIQVGAPK